MPQYNKVLPFCLLSVYFLRQIIYSVFSSIHNICLVVFYRYSRYIMVAQYWYADRYSAALSTLTQGIRQGLCLCIRPMIKSYPKRGIL